MGETYSKIPQLYSAKIKRAFFHQKSLHMPYFVKLLSLVLLVLAWILPGCVEDDDLQVDNFTDLPSYQLEQIEVLSDQGDMILGRPVYTEIDSDGKRLVMDLASFEIHVYDSEGTHQNSFGQEGDGPGEFRQPRNLMIGENDTLYVNDNTRRSLLVYAKTGVYEWSHAYDLAYPQIEGGFASFFLMPDQDGYPVVIRIRESSEEFPNGYSTVKLTDNSGSIIHNTDVKFGQGEMLTIESGGNRIMFGLSEVANSQIAAVKDGTFYQVWTADPVIYHYSNEGELLNTIELAGYPLQRAASQYITELNDRVFGGQFGNQTNALREAVGEYFPAFSQIMVMKDDSIWLSRIVPDSRDQHWYHLSPLGEPLGKLNLESGFNLRNADANMIYVSGEDENGSPAIIRYRFTAS